MVHRTVREPTDEELEDLKRIKRQEVGRGSVRARIVFFLSNLRGTKDSGRIFCLADRDESRRDRPDGIDPNGIEPNGIEVI